jgi:hypothetical protein
VEGTDIAILKSLHAPNTLAPPRYRRWAGTPHCQSARCSDR